MSMAHASSLFVSSLISFFGVVQFSEYRSFTSLVRLIPRYLIFLVAISNGIFLLIPVSAVSLLVYKNDFDFWILTLNPAVCQIHLLGRAVFWRSLQDFLCTLSCHLHTRTVWNFLRKLKMELPFDQAIPLLGLYPKNPETPI